jgi:hypothetical protein
MVIPHWLIDYGMGAVFVCSMLHTFLPPYDFLSDFPRAQKVYKAAIFAIGYVALNARSTVYKSISTDSGTKISEVNKP